MIEKYRELQSSNWD